MLDGVIDLEGARARLRGVVARTRLLRFPDPGGRDLRLKLECEQVTGSFKARGAWNHASRLAPGTRVVTVSSGNHGKALAWAARRAGLVATIVMPEDAYPNKIAACRDEGAEVFLARTRLEGEERARALEQAGAVFVPPYDSWRTIEGQATVGLEIVEEWPEVEHILVPLGGGGLLSGCALACRGKRILGVEPEGAPKMTLALARGEPVRLDAITTRVQGLSPPSASELTLAIVREHVERVFTLPDEAIFEAQRVLVREAGLVVEPAGAAAFALARSGLVADARRVAVVVSGGNPDPAQLASLSR
jgi:threonine dehydratase